MKTIGLLGGMSWESTVMYYRAINELVKKQLGGLHSARVVMVSVDFEPLEKLQHAGQWDQIAGLLTGEAQKVEAAGADFLLICTNTMHKVAPQVESGLNIPLLHIADATAEVILEAGIETVGLLGTGFTMEQDFYKGRLRDKYGLQVQIPKAPDRDTVHRVIYDELCQGEIREESKREFLHVIDDLSDRGAQAVILGCTEIGLLVRQCDTQVKLVDTSAVHAQKAVELAVRG